MTRYNLWALSVIEAAGLTTASHVDRIGSALFDALIEGDPRMSFDDAAWEAGQLAERLAD